MNIIKRIVFMICLFAFFNYLSMRGHRANKESNTLNKELLFQGIIEKKVHYRGYYTEIKMKNNESMTIGPLTSELFLYCEKGDSIIKNTKNNTCTLKRNSKKIIFDCFIQAE